MIASQTIFLNEDRTKAVASGDPAARFKLVHIGQEISEAQAEKYEGAIELIGGTRKNIPASGSVETREPKVTHRDPQPKLSERMKKRLAKGG